MLPITRIGTPRIGGAGSLDATVDMDARTIETGRTRSRPLSRGLVDAPIERSVGASLGSGSPVFVSGHINTIKRDPTD